jgi:hypothetical protein
MAIGILGSTDPTLIPKTRTFLIYDKTTGQVLHVHRSVSFPKSPPSREEPEARARRIAQKAAENADVLEVDPSEVDGKKSGRVDIATLRLVASDG